MTTLENPLWINILKAKYFPNSSSMFASSLGGSQFWKDLVKVRPVFKSLVKFVVGNGKSTRSWLDWWCGTFPLAVSFPVLFSYCPDLEISISEFSGNNWDLALRRSLSLLKSWMTSSVLLRVSPCSRRGGLGGLAPLCLRTFFC